ncbi:hypothetical protein M513_13251 [Trichuris suis]|uniref:Uncharacterized protein n=1 Tax=Trichuris suis TaxID=68888 RepID=A0A085LLM8_9BILA|nr:hypothetical protein M513_13251 [Trichuris suis]
MRAEREDLISENQSYKVGITLDSAYVQVRSTQMAYVSCRNNLIIEDFCLSGSCEIINGFADVLPISSGQRIRTRTNKYSKTSVSAGDTFQG